MVDNATVTLSLYDFDELRKKSKAYEMLDIDLSNCMMINLTEYEKRIQELNKEIRNMTNDEYDKALNGLLDFVTIKINKSQLQKVLFSNYKPKNVGEEMVMDEDLFKKDNLKIEYVEESKNE